MKSDLSVCFYLSILLFVIPAQSQPVTITFKVIPDHVPEKDSLYVTGNHRLLGMWQPAKIALDKQVDGSWMKSLSFSKDTVIEFKITRGSWFTEAISADGSVPPNAKHVVNKDTTIIIRVEDWKDNFQQIPGKIMGKIVYHRNMKGAGIKNRDIIVWLPEGYDESPEKHYPVLYMHDGQNIFDPKTSFTGIDWQIDETADSLIRQGKLAKIIIVGIYNTEDRKDDYSDTPKGQAYMKFIIHALKPFIDNTYHTLADAGNTAVMGSSMGGLISFLLTWYYPDVFSKAGCLSPAFIIDDFHAVKLVEDYTGTPKPIRLYIDNGGLGVDDTLQIGCDRMLVALRNKGFTNKNQLAWFKDSNADHNETAWARRLWRPLLFLFGK